MSQRSDDENLRQVGDAIARTCERPPKAVEWALLKAADALETLSRTPILWRSIQLRRRRNLRAIAAQIREITEGMQQGMQDYHVRFQVLALARGFGWAHAQTTTGISIGAGERSWMTFAARANKDDIEALLAQLERMRRDTWGPIREGTFVEQGTRFGGQGIRVPPRTTCCQPDLVGGSPA